MGSAERVQPNRRWLGKLWELLAVFFGFSFLWLPLWLHVFAGKFDGTPFIFFGMVKSERCFDPCRERADVIVAMPENLYLYLAMYLPGLWVVDWLRRRNLSRPLRYWLLSFSWLLCFGQYFAMNLDLHSCGIARWVYRGGWYYHLQTAMVNFATRELVAGVPLAYAVAFALALVGAFFPQKSQERWGWGGGYPGALRGFGLWWGRVLPGWVVLVPVFPALWIGLIEVFLGRPAARLDLVFQGCGFFCPSLSACELSHASFAFVWVFTVVELAKHGAFFGGLARAWRQLWWLQWLGGMAVMMAVGWPWCWVGGAGFALWGAFSGPETYVWARSLLQDVRGELLRSCPGWMPWVFLGLFFGVWWRTVVVLREVKAAQGETG